MAIEIGDSFNQAVLLLSIPVEVLEQEILSLLSCSSLIVCLLVCRRLRQVGSRLLLLERKKLLLSLPNVSARGAKLSFHQLMLFSLFEDGVPIPLLQWFQTHLRYPLFPTKGANVVSIHTTTLYMLQQTGFLDKCVSLAAKGGHLHILQHMNEMGCCCCWRNHSVCASAADGGRLEVLKWARANGCEWDSLTCAFAAGRGYLEVLKWARANGCAWDAWTCAYAAAGGFLDVLIWARENGCQWDANMCDYAARGGHLNVLKWAYETGCSWDHRTCASAAQRGHLHLLKWLRLHGCPWDSLTCAMAAAGGHLQALQWARANGCEWNSDTCEYAAAGGQLGVLQWARANGCEWNADTCLEVAQQENNSTVVEWIRQQQQNSIQGKINPSSN